MSSALQCEGCGATVSVQASPFPGVVVAAPEAERWLVVGRRDMPRVLDACSIECTKRLVDRIEAELERGLDELLGGDQQTGE